MNQSRLNICIVVRLVNPILSLCVRIQFLSWDRIPVEERTQLVYGCRIQFLSYEHISVGPQGIIAGFIFPPINYN